MNRNGKVDFLRFIFALFIMFLHFGYRPSIFIGGVELKLGQSGGFGVIFFFIVSGYLLAMSVERMTEREKEEVLERDDLGKQAVAFMIRKYRYYMKWYLPAFALCVLLDIFKSGFVPVIINCIYSIPNLLLLGSLGFSSDTHSIGYYVGASWYISTLFCSQFVLFPIMKYNYKRWIKIFAPVILMFCLGINLSKHGSVFSEAFQNMILGMLVYEAVKRVSLINFKKWFCNLMKITEVLVFLMCIVYMCIEKPLDSQIVMTFVVAGGVFLAFCPQCKYVFFQKRIFNILGKVSFPLYLLHIQILKWGEFLLDDVFQIRLLENVKFSILYATALLIAGLAYFLSEKYNFFTTLEHFVRE